MTRNTTLLAVLFATPLMALTIGSEAKAQSWQHVDRLAVQLQRQTRQMHNEVHAHFRNTPYFRHLDQDVDQMEQLARHIHDLAHHGHNIHHLRRDVEKLDRLFHHIEGVVRTMTVTGQLNFQTIRHFRGQLNAVENTLHHLRSDLRQLDHGHDHGHGPQISIGGGRWTIRW